MALAALAPILVLELVTCPGVTTKLLYDPKSACTVASTIGRASVGKKDKSVVSQLTKMAFTTAMPGPKAFELGLPLINVLLKIEDCQSAEIRVVYSEVQ
jgi:hypothetical protein